MKIKERLVWLLLVAFLITTNWFTISKVKAISSDGEKYLQIFHEVFSYIISDYVEEPKEQSLYVGAIRGLISSLGDAHSRFLDQEEFREHRDETKGSFGGIGIEVTYNKGAIIVISPIDGTPAMKAGIVPKDKIIEINGQSTQKLGIADAVKLMRGPVGTTINIAIQRKGVKEPIKLSLKRELIKIHYIKSTIIPEYNLGYIRLSQFMGMEDTANEFKSKIHHFLKSNVKGIIIDLRMNPGGLLSMATDFSDIFLPPDLDIVSVKGRGGKLINMFKSTKKEIPADKIPLIVLIDEGSASASEIFAGAMKDHKRATIIGKKSFGKGSVQNIYQLPHNTGLALTIQKYYTPSGESIHNKGIVPDIVVEPIKPTETEILTIDKLKKEKIVESFLAANPEPYTPKLKKKFIEFLKTKNYKISEPISGLILKKEINSQEKASIYDLEYDLQLIKAIDIIKSK